MFKRNEQSLSEESLGGPASVNENTRRGKRKRGQKNSERNNEQQLLKCDEMR